jgi:hypothetical protein
MEPTHFDDLVVESLYIVELREAYFPEDRWFRVRYRGCIDRYGDTVIRLTCDDGYDLYWHMSGLDHCEFYTQWSIDKELIKRAAALRERRLTELALTGTISLNTKTFFLPREIVRFIGDFLCEKIISMIPYGSKS